GNVIGVDRPGASKLPNEIGIEVRSPENTIGGADEKAGNVISGNKVAGITFQDETFGNIMQKNLVQGNFIGTDERGAQNLGNDGHGIHIKHSDGNIIGAVHASDPNKRVGEKNTIAHNGGAGIFVEIGSGNRISRNVILNNGDKGIRHLRGEKEGSQRPILTSINSNRSQGIQIKGKFDQPPLINPSETVMVEFFSSEQCNPAKAGGARFIGTVEVPERRYSNFSFEALLPVQKGHFITATATAPRSNTSEFSNCIEVK
ncbi:MAG: hypothetical protein AB1649_20000, partial [Chloroflexota bacterium]